MSGVAGNEVVFVSMFPYPCPACTPTTPAFSQSEQTITQLSLTLTPNDDLITINGVLSQLNIVGLSGANLLA